MTLPEEVPFVGAGRAKVVEFRGTMTLAEAETVRLVGTGGASVPDPEGEEEVTVPLLVGTGVTSVGEGGSSDGEGGSSVGGDGGIPEREPGTGAAKVVELTGTMMLVAMGVPLTKIVVTLGEMAGGDSTGLPVALPVGTLVVVFSGGGVKV